MIRLLLPPLEKFEAALRQPATWAERGVHMPFTSPVLFGARLRSRGAGAPEVVLAHPGGQKSFLVMPWPAAVDACRPSLADRALMRALEGRTLHPGAVRMAAAAVAATGLLGRAALGAPPAGPLDARALSLALTAWRAAAPTEEDRRRAVAVAAQAAAVALAAQSQAEPTRRAWLEDGWGLLAALWSIAEEEDRPALVRRFCAILPLAPEEAQAWPGCEPLLGVAPPSHPGAQGRFATQPRCEAAVARWIGAP
ncbi:hypothetical protein ACI6QG_12830 [Roseococcus sp. DSY-14]|uniref:hypothetical protein n=1 Tax=Roseococcus sp. DSY-14 TaxID=3369650 RepID=UPI00387A9332